MGNSNKHPEINSQHSGLSSPSRSTWLLWQGPSHPQECPGRNDSPCPGTKPTVIFKPEGQFYLGHMLSLWKFLSIPSKGAPFIMEINNCCNNQYYLLYL